MKSSILIYFVHKKHGAASRHATKDKIVSTASPKGICQFGGPRDTPSKVCTSLANQIHKKCYLVKFIQNYGFQSEGEDIMIEKLNLKMERAERKIGLLLAAILIGLFFLGLAMLFVTPTFKPAFHGLQFALLSNDPFDFSTPNPLRYRILPVLLGYVTGMRGNRFVLIPLAFAVLFIASIYGAYRKKGYSVLNALGLCAMVTFSCTILIQVISPGYTDSVLYCFVGLSFFMVKRPIWSAACFAAALLTHESALFMLPALVLYAAYIHQDARKTVLQYAGMLMIALIPLLIYRYWVSQHVAVEYSLAYYFSWENVQSTLDHVVPRLPVGLFFVFKLFWIIPILAIIKALQKREFLFAATIITILLCDLAQLLIAFDVTRMLCLGFPALLLSAEKLHEYRSERSFTKLIFLLVLLNFLVPQYFMTRDGLVHMPSFLQLIIHN